MAEKILMPRLSDTMTEGVISVWHKNVGDSVKKGDLLAEIETDKATMELESYKDGTVLLLGAKQGEKLKVDTLLLIVGDAGEDISDLLNDRLSGENIISVEEKEEQLKGEIQFITKETENVPAVLHHAPQIAEENDGRIKASPLAKKMATEKGINLNEISGSGDGGRIIKADIDSYKLQLVSTQNVQTETQLIQPQIAIAEQEHFDEMDVSQMRKIIAKRLAESKFGAPHFYLTMAIDMDAAVVIRTKMNEINPVKISFNDFVLKACAIALKEHPAINSSWLGDKIRVNHHVNIGVAVAVEEGLLVPVVRFADTKSLSQIASEVKDLAQKAKDKKLQPPDWEGNTFTISNLGMFGIEEFTAIINPPDACILAVGSILQIPVVKNGQVVSGNVMKVTLSCDHRVVDGAKGAAFLQTLKNLLEEPLRMLV
jgi:pyruvate dehydrogenase E2 component (dihydrolipoamide acetyltransferase)